MKSIRTRVGSVMSHTPCYEGIKDTTFRRGVVHLCVQMASRNQSVKLYLHNDVDFENETRLKKLIAVCSRAMSMGTFEPYEGDEVAMMMCKEAFKSELMCARSFKSSASSNDCFMPTALVNWK